MQTASWLITHQIPLLGEQRVTHVDFHIIDIPVASLLTAETFLFKDILYLVEADRQMTCQCLFKASPNLRKHLIKESH